MPSLNSVVKWPILGPEGPEGPKNGNNHNSASKHDRDMILVSGNMFFRVLDSFLMLRNTYHTILDEFSPPGAPSPLSQVPKRVSAISRQPVDGF